MRESADNHTPGFHICVAHMGPAIEVAEKALQHHTDIITAHLIELRADMHPDDKRMSIITMTVMGRAGSSTNLRLFNIGVLLFEEASVIDVSIQETENMKTILPWRAGEGELPAPQLPDDFDFRRN